MGGEQRDQNRILLNGKRCLKQIQGEEEVTDRQEWEN